MAEKKRGASAPEEKPKTGSSETAVPKNAGPEAAPKGAESAADDRQKPETSPTQEVIAAFGGLRPMANKLGIAVSTVQGWKERDSIPAARHEEILQAAAKANVTLDVARVRESDSSHHEEAAAEEAKSEGTKKDPAKAAEGKADATKGEAVKNGSVPAAGSKDKATAKSDKPDAEKGTDSVGQAAAPGKQQEQTASTPAAAPRKGGGGRFAFLSGVVVCALVLGGVVYTRGHWLPLVEKLPMLEGGVTTGGNSAEIEERLAALENATYSQATGVDENRFLALAEQVRTLALEQEELVRKIDTLTEGGVVVTTDSVDRGLMESFRTEMEENRRKLQELEQSRLSASAGATADGAQLQSLQENIARLEGELAALQSAVPSPQASPAAGDVYLALAVLQLRDALRGSEPFVEELDMVRAVAGDNATLRDTVAPLSAIAPTGLPSLTDLRSAFPEAARQAISADKVESGETWTDRALGRISDLVSIRPTDAVGGLSVPAVISRAESYLEEGDLAGAVRELDSLSPVAKTAMDDWLVQARQRLEGKAVLTQLTRHLVGLTAAGSQSAASGGSVTGVEGQ